MSSKKLNVILDLDSTIISSLRPSEPQPSDLLGYNLDNEYIIYERPHLQEFLDFIFENFTVSVWTAASKEYAVFIIDNIICPKGSGRNLQFFMFDYHTDISQESSPCQKDLNIVFQMFEGFNSSNTFIIDDYDEVYKYQLSNAYPIKAFQASKNGAASDTELLTLMNKLQSPNFMENLNKNTLNKQ